MARLSDRSVIVTGGAQGLGAEFARALAAEGARVSVSDVLSQKPQSAPSEDAGGDAFGSICDVVDPTAVARLVRETADRFGRIDGLVNNAALYAALRPRPFEMFSSEEFDRVLQVNVRGTFECVKACVPTMRQQGYGKIVNIASGTVFKGTPMRLPYVASKGAIIALTRAVAREVGRDGIRVNAVAPGLTMSEGVVGSADYSQAMVDADTKTRCLERPQLPEDLKGIVGFLVSAESDFMTGQTVVVDGGSIMH